MLTLAWTTSTRGVVHTTSSGASHLRQLATAPVAESPPSGQPPLVGGALATTPKLGRKGRARQPSLQLPGTCPCVEYNVSNMQLVSSDRDQSLRGSST